MVEAVGLGVALYNVKDEVYGSIGWIVSGFAGCNWAIYGGGR